MTQEFLSKMPKGLREGDTVEVALRAKVCSAPYAQGVQDKDGVFTFSTPSGDVLQPILTEGEDEYISITKVEQPLQQGWYVLNLPAFGSTESWYFYEGGFYTTEEKAKEKNSLYQLYADYNVVSKLVVA